jgi:eukaryotic translation initiation factor 2C
LYINDFLNLAEDKTSVRSKNADPEEEKRRMFREARMRWGNGLHPDLAESMFYM